MVPVKPARTKAQTFWGACGYAAFIEKATSGIPKTAASVNSVRLVEKSATLPSFHHRSPDQGAYSKASESLLIKTLDLYRGQQTDHWKKI